MAAAAFSFAARGMRRVWGSGPSSSSSLLRLRVATAVHHVAAPPPPPSAGGRGMHSTAGMQAKEATQAGPIGVESVRGLVQAGPAPKAAGAEADKDKCGDFVGDEEDMVPMIDPKTGEWGGPTRGGMALEPTRFGDWERKGRCTDFA